MKQKISKITIQIENDAMSATEIRAQGERKSEVLSWSRETMQWSSTGPFYPRYAKLISYLTDWMRDIEK